jgi:hypothetical protein
MENFEKREKASDMELALFLIQHINNPCEDLEGNDIREFYIREAKQALKEFQNPEAKKLLEDTIQRHLE